MAPPLLLTMRSGSFALSSPPRKFALVLCGSELGDILAKRLASRLVKLRVHAQEFIFHEFTEGASVFRAFLQVTRNFLG